MDAPEVRTLRMGGVEYVGRAFAPARRTYPGFDGWRGSYVSEEDSGEFAADSDEMRFLVLLTTAAVWDCAFALETRGPLTSWLN